MCTVKSGNKDKSVKCRFFVVPGDVTALFEMTDIELLSILRITCDIIGELNERRKFDLQTIETSSRPSHKPSKAHGSR